jgi:hypothetical protein
VIWIPIDGSAHRPDNNPILISTVREPSTCGICVGGTTQSIGESIAVEVSTHAFSMSRSTVEKNKAESF